MVRVIVLVGVIVAVVFSGGALADVSPVTTVRMRTADGRVVTARVTRATRIVCRGADRPCGRALRPGRVIVRARLGREAGGARVFEELELARG